MDSSGGASYEAQLCCANPPVTPCCQPPSPPTRRPAGTLFVQLKPSLDQGSQFLGVCFMSVGMLAFIALPLTGGWVGLGSCRWLLGGALERWGGGCPAPLLCLPPGRMSSAPSMLQPLCTPHPPARPPQAPCSRTSPHS